MRGERGLSAEDAKRIRECAKRGGDVVRLCDELCWNAYQNGKTAMLQEINRRRKMLRLIP